MASRGGSGAKAERIEVRLTPNAKALLTAAARARHTTVSEFLLTQGIAAAEAALSAPTVFYASDSGWTTLQGILNDKDHQHATEATISWLRKA